MPDSRRIPYKLRAGYRQAGRPTPVFDPNPIP